MRDQQTSILIFVAVPGADPASPGIPHALRCQSQARAATHPLCPYFHCFAKAGKRLAELHVDYEKQKEYPLEQREKPGAKLDLRVEKMRLSKDKQTLIYNDFLTLTGIPKEVYDYPSATAPPWSG